ncbi:MAG: hypothetical protein ACRDFX_08530, partial [Chloroflexota bacterium]
LTLKGHQTHILATVARDIPRLADSFLAAQPGWLQSHQKLATAIDEAYLESAHYFQTHEKGWIAAARVYTSDQTSTQGALAGIYKTLKKANLYPDDGSGFSSKVLRFNENAANTVGALTASPPPLSQWVITKYWKTAVKAVLHHSPK